MSKQEKTQYAKADDNNRCADIGRYQTIGFLRKHPFLKPVHKTANVKRLFKATFIEGLSDYRACSTWLDIIQIVKFARERNLRILPVDVRRIKIGSSWYKSRAPSTLTVRARNSLCFEISILYDLMLRKSNKGASKRLLVLAQKKFIRLSTAQRYLVYLKAQSLGVLPPSLKADLDVLHYRVSPSRHRILAEYAVRVQTSYRTERVVGFRSCRFPMLSVRERLGLRRAPKL